MMDVTKLDRELKAAGVPIHGVGFTAGVLRIDFHDSATSEQRAVAASVVAAHAPTPAQSLKHGIMGALALVIVDGPNAPQWAQDMVHAVAAEARGG